MVYMSPQATLWFGGSTNTGYTAPSNPSGYTTPSNPNGGYTNPVGTDYSQSGGFGLTGTTQLTPVSDIDSYIRNMSEEERFVRFSQTEPSVIRRDIQASNEKVNQFNNLNTTLSKMSDGEKTNRFGTNDQKSIYNKMGFDDKWLTTVGVLKGNEKSSTPSAKEMEEEVRKVAMSNLKTLLLNDQSGVKTAQMLLDNPGLQLVLTGQAIPQSGAKAAVPQADNPLRILDDMLKSEQKNSIPGLPNQREDRLKQLQEQAVSTLIQSALSPRSRDNSDQYRAATEIYKANLEAASKDKELNLKVKKQASDEKQAELMSSLFSKILEKKGK